MSLAYLKMNTDSGVGLLSISNRPPRKDGLISILEVSNEKHPSEKARQLIFIKPYISTQAKQLANPDTRITGAERSEVVAMLSGCSESYQGVVTGDLERFRVQFWEIPLLGSSWRPFRTTISETGKFDGLSSVLLWEEGKGKLHEYAELTRYQLHDMHESGNRAWGKLGVAINRMGDLSSSQYLGEIFDNNVAVIIPSDTLLLRAMIAFCESSLFKEQVRDLDQSIKVTNRTLLKIPFEQGYWKKVAIEKYPNGLPKPHSDDPTQWLFNGHPKGSEQPLHVAVARLLGYRWPRQTGSAFPDCPALGPDGLEDHADPDGIVCLPPLNREQPAAARLRALLAAALQNGGANATLDEAALLAAAGAKSKTLEDWLRDEFFEQHCKLFHQRPFVWHIWDGRKDGFHALVNYHRLDHATLQKLTYSYLGDWIRQQDADAKADKPGAAERLGAARALEAELVNILKGQPPYDLFIRWKPLSEQPSGWNPDLNDGVRLNIRPFLSAKDVGKKGAGILRAKPNIKWDKDRGKEPVRDPADFPWFWHEAEPPTDCEAGREFTGHRWNDVHFTLARKKAAREGSS